MNRRESLLAMPALLQLVATDDYKLVIEYDLLYPGSFQTNPAVSPQTVPRLMAFTARRRDSVFNLTRQVLPVGTSPVYGPSFVILLGWSNLGHFPGWNYFLNGKLPPKGANLQPANPGDRIEWRLGRHPA